jgi:hypothetical protein
MTKVTYEQALIAHLQKLLNQESPVSTPSEIHEKFIQGTSAQ